LDGTCDLGTEDTCDFTGKAGFEETWTVGLVDGEAVGVGAGLASFGRDIILACSFNEGSGCAIDSVLDALLCGTGSTFFFFKSI
jgi:hypothetical protein